MMSAMRFFKASRECLRFSYFLLTRSSMAWYFSGSRYLRDRSSSSLWMVEIPSRWQIGVNTSIVSLASPFCRSGESESSVRMLWSRSASLTMMTLTSLAIPRNIFRWSSASKSAAVILDSFIRWILVNESTIFATSSPKRFWMSSMVASVSSTTSWSNPEAMVAGPDCRLARI